MSTLVDKNLPLMLALVQNPGLDVSADVIDESAERLMDLYDNVTEKVINAFAPEDPRLFNLIHKMGAELVAKYWTFGKLDTDTSEFLARIFINIINNKDIESEEAFDDQSLSQAIDSANWVAKCLPPIIELLEVDPEKTGKGKLLLGSIPYDDHVQYIQKVINDEANRIAQKAMVKDSESDKSIGNAVSDLFAVILQTTYDVMSKRILALKGSEAQQAFIKEKNQYPDGILLEKSAIHLKSVLDVCFPGSAK